MNRKYSIATILILVLLGYGVFSNIHSDDTSISQYKDLIQLNNIEEGSSISSPLEIIGRARGNWFFEATFPVVLTNWDGLIIAEGYAEAQDDWMTTDYVPFKGEINFTKPEYNERGTLILHKANASGLPEHDDAFEITIRFQ